MCRESSRAIVELPALKGLWSHSGAVCVAARVAPGWLDREVSLTLLENAEQNRRIFRF